MQPLRVVFGHPTRVGHEQLAAGEERDAGGRPAVGGVEAAAPGIPHVGVQGGARVLEGLCQKTLTMW